MTGQTELTEVEFIFLYDYIILLLVPVLVVLTLAAFVWNQTIGCNAKKIENWRDLVDSSQSHKIKPEEASEMFNKKSVKSIMQKSEGFSLATNSQSQRITT